MRSITTGTYSVLYFTTDLTATTRNHANQIRSCPPPHAALTNNNGRSRIVKHVPYTRRTPGGPDVFPSAREAGIVGESILVLRASIFFSTRPRTAAAVHTRPPALPLTTEGILCMYTHLFSGSAVVALHQNHFPGSCSWWAAAATAASNSGLVMYCSLISLNSYCQVYTRKTGPHWISGQYVLFGTMKSLALTHIHLKGENRGRVCVCLCGCVSGMGG